MWVVIYSFFYGGEGLITEKIILWNTSYGNVRCDLFHLLEERKMTVFQLARIADIRYDVIRKYYNNEIIRYDSNVLARICYSLNCDVSEVIKYEK